MSSRLPATADIVFQYVMASEGSEKVLRSFINAVQGDGDKPLAESVSIQNPLWTRRSAGVPPATSHTKHTKFKRNTRKEKFPCVLCFPWLNLN